MPAGRREDAPPPDGRKPMPRLTRQQTKISRRSLVKGAAAAGVFVAARPTIVRAADTGTLVISQQADPTGLDPEAVLNNSSGFVMATIFDGLGNYKLATEEDG